MTQVSVKRGPRAGFTLLEVMLTLLIMAGILVSVTQILTATRQSRDMIHNVQEAQLAGPAILARIEADLRALFVYDRRNEDTLRVVNRVASGFDADRIDFVCTTDSLLPWRHRDGGDFLRADVNEVGYCLRPNPENDDFLELYRREDFGIDLEPFDGGRFALMHDRVKGLDIQCYSEDGREAEPFESWNTSEDRFDGIPARIEIELKIELAPRLVREQLLVDHRTMTYRRIIRFPESLRRSLRVQAVPEIPFYEVPIDPTTAGPLGGDEGEPGDEGGDGGGDAGNRDDGGGGLLDDGGGGEVFTGGG